MIITKIAEKNPYHEDEKVDFVIFSGEIPPNEERKQQFLYVTANAQKEHDDERWRVGYTRFGNRGGNASTNTSGEDLKGCLWEIIRDVYHSYF